jgi:hypothetical protein
MRLTGGIGENPCWTLLGRMNLGARRDYIRIGTFQPRRFAAVARIPNVWPFPRGDLLDVLEAGMAGTRSAAAGALDHYFPSQVFVMMQELGAPSCAMPVQRGFFGRFAAPGGSSWDFA